MLHFAIKYAVFTAAAAAACVSFYGWGALAQRLAGRRVKNQIVTVAAGLAAFIFLGGILNLLRLAYGLSLDILLVTGLVLAAARGKKGLSLPAGKGEWLQTIFRLLPIALIMGFTVHTQLPPKAFNLHDDFEKYFSQPVRMLQTGTLFGSPLSALGSETLGGMDVLHGVILNHLPVQFINGTDAVFGLLLCLLLSVSLLPLRKAFLPIALLSLLSVFFIDPQAVNVSALYTAAALMTAAMLLFSGTGSEEGSQEPPLPSPLLAGLIYAALAALKSSFILFPLLHAGFFVLVLLGRGADSRRLFRWLAATAAMMLGFLLPWLLLYLPHYAAASFAQAPFAERAGIAHENFPNLLSTLPQLYSGESYLRYTSALVAILLPVLLVFLKNRGVGEGRPNTRLAGLAACAATAAAAYLLFIISAPVMSGYASNFRYMVPFIIAAAPAALQLAYLRGSGEGGPAGRFLTAAPLAAGALIVIIFAGPLYARIRQGYDRGAVLGVFGLTSRPGYLEYNESVLFGDTGARIAAAQACIPEGKGVVAWVYASFHLDFRRNPVYNVSPAGIGTPWAKIPAADYFMIEYRGRPVRPPGYFTRYTLCPAGHERYVAEKCLLFVRDITDIKKDSVELYNDGRIVVFAKNRK